MKSIFMFAHKNTFHALINRQKINMSTSNYHGSVFFQSFNTPQMQSILFTGNNAFNHSAFGNGNNVVPNHSTSSYEPTVGGAAFSGFQPHSYASIPLNNNQVRRVSTARPTSSNATTRASSREAFFCFRTLLRPYICHHF